MKKYLNNNPLEKFYILKKYIDHDDIYHLDKIIDKWISIIDEQIEISSLMKIDKYH